MLFPEELKYSASDEWIKDLGDGTALVGITDFAQSEMGDIVFINLPEVGDATTKAAPFGDIESVKAVADLVSPLTAEVLEINEELLDAPEKLNSDPYGAWIIKVGNITDTEELLSAADYATKCEK